MQKRTKQAACEPCRTSKQACGHELPICTRCRRKGKGEQCTYRARPFRKRRSSANASSTVVDIEAIPATHLSQQATSTSAADTSPTVVQRYPNPGYLGSSSHAAIYNHIPDNGDFETMSPAVDGCSRADVHLSSRSYSGADVLQGIIQAFDADIFRVVTFWLARDTNLLLGGPLVSRCVVATQQMLLSYENARLPQSQGLAARLSDNSAQPLAGESSASFNQLCDELCGDVNMRWETLIVSLVALGRAIVDISFFPPHYTEQSRQRELYALASTYADRCLEIALSLDCLNDALLVSQYENWILFTAVNGNQSLDSWRRLGDVIGSLMFLGYHEDIRESRDVPAFRADWRRTAFARIYSDDKNMAVFLGRPPRVSRRSCCFQLPRKRLAENQNVESVVTGDVDFNSAFFDDGDEINNCIEIRWTALCAVLKEEVLELHRKHNRLSRNGQEFIAVQDRANMLWTNLPQHLKLEGSLKSYKHRKPIEQDFLLNARLTYLQILFLLQDTEKFLQNALQPQNGQLDILVISKEMLSLVVEAIVLRDRVFGSGTGLVWKVAHYGLPAAGILSFSLLSLCSGSAYGETVRCQKVIQDLSTFVSEVLLEGFVIFGDPSYALLHRAACSIQSLLQRFVSGTAAVRAAELNEPTALNAEAATVNDLIDALLPTSTLQPDLWGYEHDFWKMLEDYTLLTIPGAAPQLEGYDVNGAC